MAVLGGMFTTGAYAQILGAPAAAAFPVPTNVQVIRDVPYAQYGDRQLKLDMYLPPDSKSQRGIPGVLVVRGGGWRAGDKEAFGFIAGQLAKEGFVAASVEYRTVNESPLPAAVFDVKAAVRWMRAHAPTYGIDPTAIGAIGGSAGAHLVALLATSGGIEDLEGAGGNGTTSSLVQAVVAMACPCEFESSTNAPAIRDLFGALTPDGYRHALRLASPAAHVSKQAAPLLLLHSRSDPVVPFQQSLAMQERYRREDATVTLKEVDAPGSHAFWNDARYFPATISAAVEHLRRYLLK